MKAEFYQILRSPVGLIGLLFAASMPLWASSYHLHLATHALIYVGLAYSWNIIGGLGGQISLAHSLFVGVGAMLSSALLVKLGVNMWLGLLISAFVAGAFGGAIAWIDYRFRLGHLSFALVTLAFAEVGELVVIGWDFLGGASGIYLPKDEGHLSQFQFGGSSGYFWLMLVLATASLVVNLAIVNAPLGYALRAMRGNEHAAQAVGVDLLRTKVVAMVISAVMSAVIGTAYARYMTFVDPYQMTSPMLVIEIVLFVTIGGLATRFGPLVGAGLLVPLGEYLRGEFGGSLPGLHAFLFGIVLVLVIMVLPGGLTPAFTRLYKKVRARMSGTPATPAGGAAAAGAAPPQS